VEDIERYLIEDWLGGRAKTAPAHPKLTGQMTFFRRTCRAVAQVRDARVSTAHDYSGKKQRMPDIMADFIRR